ncbi:MAG: copper homeostasis protein CutC [Niameybacter sp.]|uniref:copper homeostasis protein CutC n=1 Tax=Niameybacter sp. TaxID=2033640 RepID=UPI002FCC6A3B
MKDFNLEICIDSAESAIIAAAHGATRLELCGHLMIGGVTPCTGLIEMVKAVVKIPTYAIIRPRFGDFVYSDLEFEQMKRDVVSCREHLVDGLVLGVLTPDGHLDVERLKSLTALADGMHLTLHRAFDVCVDPFKALEDAITLGFHTILTSGQQASAYEGRSLLKDLIKAAHGRIDIMPGAGVNTSNLKDILQDTGATSIHLSAKTLRPSLSQHKNPHVYMGLPSIDESIIYETNGEEVKAARAILEAF